MADPEVKIELWGPSTDTYAAPYAPRGILAGDFLLDVTLRYNRNGTGVVVIPSDHPLASQVLRLNTVAVVFFDDTPVYCGWIEEPEIDLTPGGDISFPVTDSWDALLAATRAWVNPLPAGFAEQWNRDGTLNKRVSPWTSGKLKCQDAFDVGQIGLGDREPVYAPGRTPLVRETGNYQNGHMLFEYPSLQRSLEENPRDAPAHVATGYWNPRYRVYPPASASAPQDSAHYESTWIRELVSQNVVERLGFANLECPIPSAFGKRVWYVGTSSQDYAESNPGSWRYGPLLRFDEIAKSIEDFLALGDAGDRVQADIRWNPVTKKFRLAIEPAPGDFPNPLSVEGGEVVGGTVKLSKMPVTESIIGADGDGADRSYDGASDLSARDVRGRHRETFGSVNGDPKWTSPVKSDGSTFTVYDKRQIPKYHRFWGEQAALGPEIVRQQENLVAKVARDEITAGKTRDIVKPVLQESGSFRWTPGSNEGYRLGMRVGIIVPNAPMVMDRITSIRLVVGSKGVQVTPSVGDIETNVSGALAEAARKAEATVRMR